MACILSQHTSDANAARAHRSLLSRWPTWDDLATARAQDLADAIRMGGLANVKATRILDCLGEIRSREGAYSLSRLASLPDTDVDRYLRSLPGVGPKTAAIVLCFALHRDRVPVDTHVHRVAKRLGIIDLGTSAEAAHGVLDRVTPAGMAFRTHLALLRLGKSTCRARQPLCNACVAADVCPRVAVAGESHRTPR